MENLRAWWDGLASREKQLLSVAGVFLFIGILYWGLWTPISNAERDALRGLKAQQQTLNYVKQTANKIAGLRQTSAKPRLSASLSSVVNQTASGYGLVITRMQPQADKIQIWMDEVPFDALLAYLNELVQQKGLSLDSIDLTESDTPGHVKVRRIQLSQ